MKAIVIALLILVMPWVGFSQTIKVNEVSGNMSKGVNNGFVVEIPQAGIKDVARDWKHRLMVGNKARLLEINGEIDVRGVDNKDIAPKPFNVYSTLSSTESGVKLTVWFTYDDTVFFSSKSGNSGATAAARFVHDFASGEYYITVKNMYQKERDKLDKMKDDLEKSIRVQERGTLKIAENNRAITRAQDDLATNGDDQKEAIAAINLQQAEVNKDRSGNAEIYKAADKALTELQDNETKLKNRNEELHKKIDELAKENTTEERNIATSKQDQAKTTDAIEKQKQLIKDLAAKLKAIKA